MTKKHFIALADAVKRMEPPPVLGAEHSSHLKHFEDGQHMQWEKMRDALADFCQLQNSQFNRERWLAYIAGECKVNLQPVDLSHNGFTCVCVGCGRKLPPMEPRWADLDGPAFKAYFCKECGQKLEAGKFVADFPALDYERLGVRK